MAASRRTRTEMLKLQAPISPPGDHERARSNARAFAAAMQRASQAWDGTSAYAAAHQTPATSSTKVLRLRDGVAGRTPSAPGSSASPGRAPRGGRSTRRVASGHNGIGNVTQTLVPTRKRPERWYARLDGDLARSLGRVPTFRELAKVMNVEVPLPEGYLTASATAPMQGQTQTFRRTR